MTLNSGRVIFPQDFILYSKNSRRRSLYHETIIPVMYVLRIFGVYPYRKQIDGAVSMKYESFGFLYCVLVYIGQLAVSVKAIAVYYQGYKVKEYSSVQIYVVVFMATIPVLTAPLIWISARKIEKFFNEWIAFQGKYNYIIQEPLEKGHIKWNILIYTSLFSLIYGGFFYLVGVIHTTWYHIAFCFLCIFLHSLFMTLCVMTLRTFRIIMEHYRSQLKQVLASKFTGIRLVEEYRLLWVSISTLVQRFGASFSSLLILHLLLHSVLLVLLVYNFVGLASRYVKAKQYYKFAFSFFAPWIPFAMIYVCCNIGHLITNHCTRDIPELIVEIKSKYLSLQSENTVPVKLFLYSICDFKPSVNILGYFQINRPLFGSIISVLVTYMIVLVQFGSS